MAIAAMLHDAIEDGGGAEARERIRREFGERVVAIVDKCSDTDMTPKPPWRRRKEAYLDHLKHASEDALLVSAADKLHNARSILMDLRTHGSEVWTRFNAGREDILWYYNAVHRRLSERNLVPAGLVRELRLVIDEIESLV